MVQQYYNLEKAAEVLGLDPAQVNMMREQGELRAFRDGADWKFKKEEIDEVAIQLRSERTKGPESPDEDAEDVLLSEVELGQPGPGAAGQVIGGGEQSPEDSDIKLADSDIGMDHLEADKDTGELDIGPGPADKDTGELDVRELEEIDLTIDEDVQLEDSDVPLAEGSGSSAIELGEEVEDDELVLGGSSGSGSDVTIGQDSGISLVDPDDSGLSLDEPLELASDDDSLALGEDDMLTLSEEADTESPTELKTDDDFLLTPLEEGGEEEAESGSQVIALDAEAEGAEAATMAAGGMAPMLDEDAAGAGVAAAPLEAAPAVAMPMGIQEGAPGAALAPSAAALPEAPFGTLATVGLAACVFLLILSGIMTVDLLRNMWSWGAPYDINSSIMDLILGLLP